MKFLLENYARTGLELAVWKLFTEYMLEPEHQHDCIEMVFVLRGSGRCAVNGCTYPMIRGDLYVINPGETHSYRIDENLQCYNIMFRLSFFSATEVALLARFPAFRRFFSPESTTDHKFAFPEPFVEKLETRLAELTAELKRPRMGFELKAKALFLDIMVTFLRELSSSGEKGTASGYALAFSRIFSHIAEHFSEKLTLQVLARIGRINPNYFGELFRKTTGMSVSTYLSRFRIEQSSLLLEQNQESIGEIALHCGFYDTSHFSRTFKSTVGISPKEYRQQWMNRS